MKPFVLAVLTLSLLTGAVSAQSYLYKRGTPYGQIAAVDISRLEAFAKNEGVELMADMRRAYQKDQAALGRLFAFSIRFNKLDENARTYGEILFTSLNQMSKVYGAERFAQIVAAQPEAVRQRVRDFYYYDVTFAPKAERAEAEAAVRRNAPLLFPDDYVFSADSPLFRRR